MVFEDFSTLTYPKYESFSLVSRCMHFDDVKRSHDKKLLMSYKISKCVRYKIDYLKKKKVWWFAPAISPEESQYYGNVSYEISWSKLLSKFGPNIYEIDTLSLFDRVVSRILITDADHDDNQDTTDDDHETTDDDQDTTDDDQDTTDEDQDTTDDDQDTTDDDQDTTDDDLETIDDKDDFLTRITKDQLQVFGYPIKKVGRTYHSALSTGGKLHFLAIAVEDTGKGGGKWLFDNCDEVAIDHSDVNEPYDGPQRDPMPKFNSNKCFKFNTVKNVECKFDFNLVEAEDRLEDGDFSRRKK